MSGLQSPRAEKIRSMEGLDALRNKADHAFDAGLATDLEPV
jgi:hypothetical protein